MEIRDTKYRKHNIRSGFIVDYIRNMRFRGSASLLSFILISITLISCMIASTVHLPIYNRAFADGLSQEQISASMGSRKADLLIKTTPPVVTTETLRHQNKNQ